jgi:hypothetical protein
VNAAERKLRERAEGLTVKHRSGRTYDVSSATEPGRWYVVRGAVDQPLGEWTCSCEGAGGRKNFCSHKRALARHLMITERPERAAPAPRREPMQDQGGALRWVGSITDRATAVQVHGGVEGGARVTLDIPDDGRLADIIGRLTSLRRAELVITIEPKEKTR